MFMIEKVDEIRHFYQLTASAQSSYDLSQNRILPPNLTNTWNL
jgi:hypothetical protein